MLKVLIVEDDAEKLRRVLACLLEVFGLAREDLMDARDVASAKRLLRDNKYDLLVLDISVPSHSDELPSYESGIKLLEEILGRDVYKIPGQIVGLSAYEEAVDLARPKFEIDSLQIIQYDVTTLEWKNKLQRIARRLVAASKQEDYQIPTYGVDLCVLTALVEPELTAVLDLPWKWASHELPNDSTQYYRGTFQNKGIDRSVIAAAAPRMGMQASAVLATKMGMTFRPRYLAMAGILAGVEGKCDLGDILVADPGWDYGSGKQSVHEGEASFASAPHQVAINPFIRGKIARMAQDAAIMDEIRREWKGAARRTVLSMHLGPVASGAAVLEDPMVVAEIKRQHRKTLGVEMETYGVLVAAEECPEPRPNAVSIKSVCDFADPRKNNDYQAYAAYTSAQALRILFERFI